MKYRGNFFSLPNEIFLLGLSPGELAVYCYLRRCENQKTHQCWPSYKTIGDAVGRCENTVSKYIQKLIERGCRGAHQGHDESGRDTQRDLAVHFASSPECDRPALRGKAGRAGTGSRAAAGARTPGAAGQEYPVQPAVRRCVPSLEVGEGPCPPPGLEKSARQFGGEEQEKLPGSCAPRQGRNCPQCGQFRGWARAFQNRKFSH